MKNKTEVWMAAQIKAAYPEADWNRVENAAGVGMPDMNGAIGGQDVWIENKITENGIIRKLAPSQICWFTKRKGKSVSFFFFYDNATQQWLYTSGRNIDTIADYYKRKRDIRDVAMLIPTRMPNSDRVLTVKESLRYVIHRHIFQCE